MHTIKVNEYNIAWVKLLHQTHVVKVKTSCISYKPVQKQKSVWFTSIVVHNQRMRAAPRDYSAQVSTRLPLINHVQPLPVSAGADTCWQSIPLRFPSGLFAHANISWHKKAFILVQRRFIGFSVWFICVWQPPLLPRAPQTCLMFVFGY